MHIEFMQYSSALVVMVTIFLKKSTSYITVLFVVSMYLYVLYAT